MTNDDDVAGAIRRHFDAAANAVDASPDVADVRHRLRRRHARRVGVVGIVSAAAVLVGVVVAWPADSTQRVAITTKRDTAAAQQARAAAEVVRLDGDRPDVIAAVNRTTPDGLRLRALLLDSTKDPRNVAVSNVSERCTNPELADVVAQLPYAGYAYTQSPVPRMPAGSVFISVVALFDSAVGGQRSLPSGAVDPRTIVEPAPGATPEAPSADGYEAYTVVARGDATLRGIAVTYLDGKSDETDASDGFAVVGVRHRSDAGTLIGSTPTSIVVTFADGHVLDVDTTTFSTSQIFGPDGERRDAVTSTEFAAGRCNPIMPTLPPAGDAPKDEADASAAVAATVETAANGALPIEQRLSAFLDPDRGRRIVEELGAANVAGAANSSGTLRGLSFISPTEAVITFDVTLPPEINGQQIPSSYLTAAFGKVVLDHGEWLITSETICKLVGSITPKACLGVKVNNYPTEAYVER